MQAEAKNDPSDCAAKYTGTFRHGRRLKQAIARVTAGLIWPPRTTAATFSLTKRIYSSHKGHFTVNAILIT